MVHQLSLVSSIPHTSYVQMVTTLQALTGLSSPQEIATYTLITKPHDVFRPKLEPGKVNQIEQYHMRCITTWKDNTSETLDISKPILKNDQSNEILADRLFVGDDTKKQWTLQIADIPNAGKNQACSAQNIHESTLVHHHTSVKDIERIKVDDGEDTMEIDKKEDKKEDEMEVDKKEDVMDVDKNDQADKEKDEVNGNTDGEPKTEEISKVKYIDEDLPLQSHAKSPDNNIKKETPPQTPNKTKEIEITKRKDSFLQFLEDLGYDLINQYWIKGIRFFHGDIIIEFYKIFIRDDSPSSNNDKLKLKLLDESNTFQIKTYINFPKSTDVESINQGTKDLLKLQDFFKNLFKLEIPDRMYMDSRITNRQS